MCETNFKFFVLFVAWTAIYCFFTLIVMAVFVAELHHEVCKFRLLLVGLAGP